MQGKVELKICGITRQADLDFCVGHEVEYVGFNFFRGSKRYLQPEVAARLWANRAASSVAASNSVTRAVAVVVNSSRSEIAAILKTFSDIKVLQFHGSEPDDTVRWVQMTYPHLLVWRASPVAEETDLCRAVGLYRATPVDLVLLDAASSSLESARDSFGGTGKRFDWGMLHGANLEMTFGVAGGLNPISIPQLFRNNLGSSFGLIDVASGAERSPGIKDEALMEQIVTGLRSGSFYAN